MQNKVFIGLSGGVDSSAAAKLLLSQGYDVEGLYLIMTPEKMNGVDIGDAKKTAGLLGIKFNVLDCTEEFEKHVLDYFADEYIQGRTPNPCAICNPKVKFKKMLEYADNNGGGHIATGHYAINEYSKEENAFMLRASPSNKDQSYFLSRLNQDILKRVLFPLGRLEKDDVRAYCLENGLPA
ncbi:MAG: tRNA 2-thiouridine(34) synthase MnmA, partial [Oscillospiraceae bacterium]|nr:tRNA 2-thiouridine(34) synthase MnmA [Oscillospiraceae bacterium]